MALDKNIVLIGPSKTGKTTISELLGQRLSLPVVQLDDLRWDYYAEIGYDHDYAQKLRQAYGLPALAYYWKPFDIHAVERVMADYPAGHVIAFGAGHSVYEDTANLGRAQRALAGHDVVLMLPTPDIDQAFQMLEARLGEENPDYMGSAISFCNQRFLEHPSNAALATLTVYTSGQSAAQTCESIIARLGL